MGMIRLSEHIWAIRSLLNIQVWLVKGEGGTVLVDCGVPPMANTIIKGIHESKWGPLEKIVLTHGHPDHVGGLEKILSHYPVPVYAHFTEIPYMEGKLPHPPFKKPRVRVKPSLTKPLSTNVDGKLTPIDGLVPFLTPGHSPGHVAYYHEEDRVLIGGDLFMTRFNQLKRPLSFATEDMDQAVESGSLVMSLQPHLLSVCHGKEILRPHELYPQYHRRWEKKK